MRLRRTRLVLPSAFTAGNIFFGLFAMISSFRGELEFASYLIIIGGLLDFIDGKVAKISKTHTRFGGELDSLADMVTFGVAPAVVMYFFLFEGKGEWSWLLMYLFVVAGALRLARFNVEHPGPAKKSFTGLPIPVAGAALVSFIPFSATGIPNLILTNIGHGKYMAVLIVLLSILMVSNVRYPTFPRINVRSVRGSCLLACVIAAVSVMIVFPEYTIFPFSIMYVGWGLLKEVIGGFVEPETGTAAQETESPLLLRDKRNERNRSSF